MPAAPRSPPSSSVRTAVAVMTVDDQEVFRTVAREVVEATPGFEPAGEAASGEEAMELVEATSPQLVLVDVRMPGMDGVETARRLSAAHPELVIVLISLEDPPPAAATPAESGAVTFARKQDFGPDSAARAVGRPRAGAPGLTRARRLSSARWRFGSWSRRTASSCARASSSCWSRPPPWRWWRRAATSTRCWRRSSASAPTWCSRTSACRPPEPTRASGWPPASATRTRTPG